MTGSLKKLLYIEDDDNIAEITKMTLEDLGDFEVHHCASGQEALEIFPIYGPQLVISDVMMPDMDGPETLARLRTMPEAKNVPVIFMTAKAQIHEQKNYTEMGVLGVIVKPYDPMVLCDEINELWNSHQSLRKNFGSNTG